MTNYQEMEQSHWACYEFPDKTYYYGEVGFLDESGVVQSKDNAEAANNPKNKLVKHGFGVYVYNAQPEGQSARYEVSIVEFRGIGIETGKMVKES